MKNMTLKNQVIVILKDRKKNLTQLLDALQLARYIILIVPNKQDYVSVIKSIQPSSIVMDFMMSEVDVWQVCQKLKSDRATTDLPLVFINSSEDVAKKIAELGWQNVDCLAQSSEPEETVCLIKNRLLAKRHSQTNCNLNTKLNTFSSTQHCPSINVNRDLDSFAYIVSHKLQTSLRSLTTFTELLSNEYQDNLDAKGREYLECISNSSSKIQASIENLQIYFQAGKSEQTWITVDLKEICLSVVENLQSAITQTKAQIVVKDLPKILTNPTEISRVLQNLLENAIKFSGANNPYIEVDATKKEEEWLIWVCDNGVGITEEFQSKIFQTFYQLDSTDDSSGIGMGLTVCQKIVEGFGGTMGVKSTKGKGSTFYFTLPIEINFNRTTPNISMKKVL